MKLETIVNAYPALSKLAGQDLPLPVLYRFSKLLAALEPEINFFIQQREKLFEKYGEISAEGYTVDADKVSEFEAELKELTEMETEASVQRISLPLVGNVALSFADLRALEEFVTLEGGEDA